MFFASRLIRWLLYGFVDQSGKGTKSFDVLTGDQEQDVSMDSSGPAMDQSNNPKALLTPYPNGAIIDPLDGVKLTCEAGGLSVKYSWTFNGRVYKDQTATRTEDPNEQLVYDPGNYSCIITDAKNRTGRNSTEISNSKYCSC